MSKIRILLIVAAGLQGAGCASDMTGYYATQQKAIEADNNAVMALATAAATGNQGAIMALALRRSAAGNIAVPQDKALAWASILVPGVTQLYGIQKNTQVQLRQIDAEASKYGATLDAITGVASQGITAAAKDPVIVEPFVVEVPTTP